MPSTRRSGAMALGIAVLLLAGLLTYGFVLGLPFFLDDLVHFRWVERQSVGAIWRSARTLGYYRPVPSTLWKVLASWQGGFRPFPLHAANLGLHILNAVLVLVFVAGRSRGNDSRGLAAAALFLLFPFSYQVVPWVTALTHLLVTAVMLGALILRRLAQVRRSRWLQIMAIALAGLAPFVHETGMLLPFLVLLDLQTQEEPMPLGRALHRTLPYGMCAALGLAAWSLVPKSLGQLEPFNLESRWQNGVYFAQGLTYPFSSLATRLLAAVRGLNDLQAVALVSLPLIVVWAVLWTRGRQGKDVALALGWFAIMIAPSWALRGFDYVIDGPRLFYEASVGIAIFWSIPVDHRWGSRGRRLAGTMLAVVVTLVATLGGLAFIRARVPLYEEIKSAVSQLLAITQGFGPSDSLLCINYPTWFAPLNTTYALGHEGVTLVPAYAGVADLVWAHTGRDYPAMSLTLPDLKSHWRYHYACLGDEVSGEGLQGTLRQVQHVILTTYEESGLLVSEAGGLEAEQRPRREVYLADWGSMALAKVAWECEASSLQVTLRWHSLGQVRQDTTVFVHLYGEAGQLVTQSDGYPLMGTSRLVSWEPGDVWRDVRQLQLPGDLAPGQYTLKVGLYTPADVKRIPATGPGGEHFADEAVPIGTLKIPSACETQ